MINILPGKWITEQKQCHGHHDHGGILNRLFIKYKEYERLCHRLGTKLWTSYQNCNKKSAFVYFYIDLNFFIF